ncbi:MAG: hypothetical protein ACYTDY_13620, partial [Planctomycetota bacterium]
LEIGRATLPETLETLGPPDILLRTRDRDRADYLARDTDYFKVVISWGVPPGDNNWSKDFIVWDFGTENLKFARMDFDRRGVLRERQLIDEDFDQEGRYVLLENAAVEQFLEDRERALGAGGERSDDKRDAKKEAFANEDRADE